MSNLQDSLVEEEQNKNRLRVMVRMEREKLENKKQQIEDKNQKIKELEEYHKVLIDFLLEAQAAIKKLIGPSDEN